VIHHYGYGGSGWSLSWGYGYEAMQMALATGEHDFAVIGCGAIGLTTAVLLARAGARVTIYAKDLPPFTRSSWATGVFTPDSRIALAEYATPEFKKTWNERARYSYRTYQSLLGLADQPVEYLDFYAVNDGQAAPGGNEANEGRPAFAELAGELLADLEPKDRTFPAGTHTLGAHALTRSTTFMFNLSSYTHFLMSDFRSAGGKIEVTEFTSPADFSRLPQKTLVHATGYGARALLNDDSIIPVRGQIARTPPQEGIHYALEYRDRGSLKTPLLRAVGEPRVDDATNNSHGSNLLMMQAFGELSNYRYLRFTRMRATRRSMTPARTPAPRFRRWRCRLLRRQR